MGCMFSAIRKSNIYLLLIWRPLSGESAALKLISDWHDTSNISCGARVVNIAVTRTKSRPSAIKFSIYSNEWGATQKMQNASALVDCCTILLQFYLWPCGAKGSICKALCLQPRKQKYAIFRLQSASMHLNRTSHKKSRKSIWACSSIRWRMNANQQSSRDRTNNCTQNAVLCVCMQGALCSTHESWKIQMICMYCAHRRVYMVMRQEKWHTALTKRTHFRSSNSKLFLDSDRCGWGFICVQPVSQICYAKCLGIYRLSLPHKIASLYISTCSLFVYWIIFKRLKLYAENLLFVHTTS